MHQVQLSAFPDLKSEWYFISISIILVFINIVEKLTNQKNL